MSHGDCRYIREMRTDLKNETEMLCKRGPPQLVAIQDSNGRWLYVAKWPIVRKTDESCGEFYAKERN